MKDFINTLRHKTVEDLSQMMLTYAENGDFNIVRTLLTSPEIDNHADITYKESWVLSKACSSGNLKLVKYLLTSPELKEHADINADDDLALLMACRFGYIKMIKYLLTSPDLKKHANINSIQSNEMSPLKWAAHNNYLDVIKYLTTSPELKEHVNLNLQGIGAVKSACIAGNLEILQYLFSFPQLDKPIIGNVNSNGNPFWDEALSSVSSTNHIHIAQYLLESNEYGKKADIHANNDAPFKKAFNYESYEMLKYFIFDLNIEKTEEIKGLLASYPNPEVEKMFSSRDLNSELHTELIQQDNKKKNLKI